METIIERLLLNIHSVVLEKRGNEGIFRYEVRVFFILLQTISSCMKIPVPGPLSSELIVLPFRMENIQQFAGSDGPAAMWHMGWNYGNGSRFQYSCFSINR